MRPDLQRFEVTLIDLGCIEESDKEKSGVGCHMVGCWLHEFVTWVRTQIHAYL